MKNIFELFDNAIFRIPDYQRGYAWESEQLEDYWKDINWLAQEHKHYTGLITLRGCLKTQLSRQTP